MNEHIRTFNCTRKNVIHDVYNIPAHLYIYIYIYIQAHSYELLTLDGILIQQKKDLILFTLVY